MREIFTSKQFSAYKFIIFLMLLPICCGCSCALAGRAHHCRLATAHAILSIPNCFEEAQRIFAHRTIQCQVHNRRQSMDVEPVEAKKNPNAFLYLIVVLMERSKHNRNFWHNTKALFRIKLCASNTFCIYGM